MNRHHADLNARRWAAVGHAVFERDGWCQQVQHRRLTWRGGSAAARRSERAEVMEFRLTYAGKLLAHRENKTRERSLHVHDIRKEFHKQLRTLWNEHPVLKRRHPADSDTPDPEIKIGTTFEQNGFKWKPIVTEESGLMCAVDILMLRKGLIAPGAVQADIDNRLFQDPFRCLAHAAESTGIRRRNRRGEAGTGARGNSVLHLVER